MSSRDKSRADIDRGTWISPSQEPLPQLPTQCWNLHQSLADWSHRFGPGRGKGQHRAWQGKGTEHRAWQGTEHRAQGTSLPCQKHPNPNNSMRLQPEPALKAEPELSTASCPGWIQDGPCPPGWSLGTPGLSRDPEWDLLDPALGRERGLKGGCRVHRAHCSHFDMQD